MKFDFQNGNGTNGDTIDGVGGGGSLNGTMRTAPRTPSAHRNGGGTAYHSNPVRLRFLYFKFTYFFIDLYLTGKSRIKYN